MEKVDYPPRAIDENFFDLPDQYPITGMHNGHEVRAEGKVRFDEENKPYPTRLGIHGVNVAVDWDSCIADGSCMEACPMNGFEWALNPGKRGKGNDRPIERGTLLWDTYRTDKADPVGEKDCILCNACVAACPAGAISVAKRK
ncbi:MAG: ferredoxin family protein [Candidatus Thermoplasmatota archaeon]|jgi:NAD-dependent dihydropyrimidine dehydrogenase PreA subunit|nr:ferredoxin family protein [Candidatus Thermoplasmatota archaeon]MCL5680874.1 ferredoxin family protein [Candidatus Thermoplasmatota archaeon]